MYIISGIILLLAAILLTKAALDITYDTAKSGETAITLRILFLRIPVFPKKKKKIKASDFSKKKLERAKRKADKKAARKAKRAKKRTSKDKTSKSLGGSASLLDNISLISKVLGTVAQTSIKHIKVKKACVRITVATPDAAETAMLFGAVNIAAAALVGYIDNFETVNGLDKAQISVQADFCSEKTRAFIKIILCLRVWHILKIIFKSALRYLSEKSGNNKKQKQA